MVGNVKLAILSERMVKSGTRADGDQGGVEKLIVKWKTCSRSGDEEAQGVSASEAVRNMTRVVEDSTKPDEEFVGLFIFEFDSEGRIVTHTIEHVEEGGSWDKTARVISVTDWLLGRAWGKRSEGGTPGLAFAQVEGTANTCRSRKSI